MNIKNIILKGAEGRPITADLFFKDDGKIKPVVVYAHGFNGFKDWGNFDLIAEEFAASDFILMKFNFSHNGTTPQRPEEFADLEAFGNNNYSRQLADLKIVTDWICDKEDPNKQAFDTNNIYLIGHSMGGGIAILFAAVDNRIKKVVAWAGISECKTPWGNWPAEKMEEWEKAGVQYYKNTRTNQQMPLYYQLYLDYENNRNRLNIETAIKKLLIPVLICHGTLDIAVPVENAYLLKEWNPSAELFIVESNHVFDRQHPWPKAYLPEAMDTVLQKTILFLQ